MSEENKNVENEANDNIENNNDTEDNDNIENNDIENDAGDFFAEETNAEAAEDKASPEYRQTDEPPLSLEKPDNNGSKKAVIAAIAAVAAIFILAGGAFAMQKMGIIAGYNKYNNMGYINISGRTLADVSEDAGMTVDEFKAEYQLPEDMKDDTDEAAAFYNIPTGKIAEMYGMEFSEIMELLQLPDTVTETTPWGEAEGEAALKNYVGEDAIDAFKEEYNLGDDVTGDTKWKEVRNIVDQAALDQRLALEDESVSENSQQMSEEDIQAIIDSMSQGVDEETATEENIGVQSGEAAQTGEDSAQTQSAQ